VGFKELFAYAKADMAKEAEIGALRCVKSHVILHAILKGSTVGG
jgi:hypothetical protein